MAIEAIPGLTPLEVNMQREQPISRSEYLQFVVSQIQEPKEIRGRCLQSRIQNIEIAKGSLRYMGVEQIKKSLRHKIANTSDGKVLQEQCLSVFETPAVAQVNEDLREISILQMKYKKEVDQIEKLTPKKYAEQVFLPKLIERDFNNENRAAIKEWVKTFPKGFCIDSSLFLRAIDLALNQDEELFRSLLALFVEFRDSFTKLDEFQISGRFSQIAVQAAETHNQDRLSSILNAMHRPFIHLSALENIIDFALDTQNENLLSLVLHSKQSQKIRESALQKVYANPRTNIFIKARVERLWLKKRPNLNGLRPPIPPKKTIWSRFPCPSMESVLNASAVVLAGIGGGVVLAKAFSHYS